MREYLNEKTNATVLNKAIKLMISIVVSAVVFVILAIICSTIIAKTNVSENYESIMMIVISAITSIILSVLMTFSLDSKGILCALYSFMIMFGFKLLMTKALGESIGFGRQGIVGLIFTVIFCLAGSIAASNIKK